jgi:hypothetical protein
MHLLRETRCFFCARDGRERACGGGFRAFLNWNGDGEISPLVSNVRKSFDFFFSLIILPSLSLSLPLSLFDDLF